MSLDKLTDDEFFKLYNRSPEIKKLVDGIQMQYHAHSSQKGQPGYDPGNMAWYAEAKEAVSGIIEAQKNKAEAPNHQATHEATHPTSLSPRFKAGLGLAAIVTFMVIAASGIPTMPYMPPPLY